MSWTYVPYAPDQQLLTACLCDTSPEQLARTFTLANDLSGGTLFCSALLAQHPIALDSKYEGPERDDLENPG